MSLSSFTTTWPEAGDQESGASDCTERQTLRQIDRQTDMIPKTRLGKRSPMGALVYPSQEDSVESQGLHRDSGPQPHLGRVKLHPGQKVYVICGGQECCGVVQQHNHMDNQVSILLPALGQHILRKVEDVWTTPSTPPPPPTTPSTVSSPLTVSSCIDVPRSNHSPEAVDMDEMMAALVLTSLSCSPLLQSLPQRDITGVECGGGELSDSGSSGYWSLDCGNGSPDPSPPMTEAEGSLAMPPDEGLDMELEQVLFDEPAPRRRRNSVKLAYRCLWPSCGKVLTSVVGIKRHIRTLHLGQSGEHERCSRSEEDFYYTEIHQRDPLTPPPPVPSSLTLSRPESPSDGGSQPSPLSLSAPSASGSIWQVHSEHSYQAPAPVCVVAPNPTSHCKQAGSFRVRSVSVGEQWLQQHSASIRPHPAGTSPPRTHWTSRRVRGEAKKCRKVYGIEHRDQWCTACRWKKACQRFLD
ncbi:zinc finger protein 395a isoform X1 [Hypomesus transpacificus]|uniref:zinc finger protein 395a isoform X1 n=1 Tax=Hypomesus transpacificus TaxID=137520 RepID=UPI001F07BB7F|nr:zinc finger protein 395a isoform X1 [Hypomesus transpacificus]XP_046887545.1 zinc finger protein 395a isoform X1 [Hypomesus transpacificus]